MKRNMLFILIILSVVLIFSACSNNSTEENSESDQNNETPVENNQGDNNTNDPQEEQKNDDVVVEDTEEGNEDALPSGESDGSEGTMLAGSVMTIAQIEGSLAIGASQEDVAILFDSHPYQEVVASYDGADAWRYDFGAQSAYSHEVNSDIHDHEGILNGDVPLQVFIYFDEKGSVSGYTAYKAGEEGTIKVYQTLNDGTRKIETIE